MPQGSPSVADWIDDPEAQVWARRILDELVPMIDQSAVVVSLLPTTEADVKFAVETGLSIMLDKPIIIAVQPGTVVPAKMMAVADEVIEFDPSAPDMGGRLQDAYQRVIAKYA